MNNKETLERLLREAARTGRDSNPEMPPALATRVLAHWREAQEPDAAVVVLFQRAFVCACVIAGICAALNYSQWSASSNPELLAANSAIYTEMNP